MARLTPIIPPPPPAPAPLDVQRAAARRPAALPASSVPRRSSTSRPVLPGPAADQHPDTHMPMYAREFFAELNLPFADATVVGNTYYATPRPRGRRGCGSTSAPPSAPTSTTACGSPRSTRTEANSMPYTCGSRTTRLSTTAIRRTAGRQVRPDTPCSRSTGTPLTGCRGRRPHQQAAGRRRAVRLRLVPRLLAAARAGPCYRSDRLQGSVSAGSPQQSGTLIRQLPTAAICFPHHT